MSFLPVQYRYGTERVDPPEMTNMVGGRLYRTKDSTLLASRPHHFIRAQTGVTRGTFILPAGSEKQPAIFLFRSRSGKHFATYVYPATRAYYRELRVLDLESAINLFDSLEEKTMPFEEAFRVEELDSEERLLLEQAIGPYRETKYKYDVAVSFSGDQRDKAEGLARIARDAGYSVFYDDWYPEDLWGSELSVSLESVYSEESRFCVIFISEEYVQRAWTNVERQSAISRAVRDREPGYILPIKIDDVKVPGLPDTIRYMSLSKYSIPEIGGFLLRKLRKAAELDRHV